MNTIKHYRLNIVAWEIRLVYVRGLLTMGVLPVLYSLSSFTYGNLLIHIGISFHFRYPQDWGFTQWFSVFDPVMLVLFIRWTYVGIYPGIP